MANSRRRQGVSAKVYNFYEIEILRKPEEALVRGSPPSFDGWSRIYVNLTLAIFTLVGLALSIVGSIDRVINMVNNMVS